MLYIFLVRKAVSVRVLVRNATRKKIMMKINSYIDNIPNWDFQRSLQDTCKYHSD